MIGNQGPFSLPKVTGLVVPVSTNYVVQAGVSTVLASATSAAITITLPLAATNPNRSIVIQKVDAGSYGVIITCSGQDSVLTGRTTTLSYQYGTLELISNGKTGWVVLRSSRWAAPLVTSSSSGPFITTSPSPVAITNLTVTLTTTGNPVVISFSDSEELLGSSIVGAYATSGAISAAVAVFQIWRDGVQLTQSNVQSNAGSSASFAIIVPPGTLNHIDPAPIAGSHTYALYSYVSSSATLQVNYMKMSAYEQP